MLTPQQINLLREELATAKNPIFFFDDDPDGLCSFLLLYKLHREGHGIVVKTLPKITVAFLRKVEEYHPDKLFLLDMPIVEQDFIDAVPCPIFWLDHHPPLERQHIRYFNPRLSQPHAYFPTSRLAYQISQNPGDLWLAMLGCLGDYHLPDFHSEFTQKYPDLLPANASLEEAIYHHPIGRLVRLFAFLLKGKTSDVNKCVKILTRIKSPYEILRQETSQGRYLYQRFEKIDQKYQSLLEKAKKTRAQGKILLFTYTAEDWSFTSELASELFYLHPDKLVLVARRKSGEMKCSLRSPQKIPLLPLLEKALVGLDGYGGGHEFACGANVKEQDWPQFLANLKRELKIKVSKP